MKQLWLSLVVLLALAAWGGAAPSVSAQASGKITGTVTGPSGPLAGVTVKIVNNAGVVVGTAVTTSTGAYAVENLPPGRYTVQVVISSKVAGTGAGTVTATIPAAVVDVSLTSSQLAPAAVAAGSGHGMGTTTKVVLTVATVAATGIIIKIATKDDTSPTR